MATISPCCRTVLRGGLTKKDADELATLFKALADPARLRLLGFIASQPDGEACVCHLTDPVGLSQPTVSHHLKLLHDEGLLERDKRGAWVYYRIVPERLEQARAALATRDPRPRARRQA
ncbi:MAG TPA: metalloregulator ArsR/SmtB family transcription factor [Candidatus Binatia bacterium]|nr:metalloregulator ArsR/SmtB family transcription factor [Candidatus Binatia bacterium]